MHTKPRPETMSQTIKAVSVGFEALNSNTTDLKNIRGFTNSFIDSGLRYRPVGISKREAFKAPLDHLLENATPLARPVIKDEIETFASMITTPVKDLANLVGVSEEKFLSGK